MKKTLVLITCLAGAVSGYSQGQVYMGDYANSDFQITIWSPQAGNPGLSLQGNSSAAFGTSHGTAADGGASSGTADFPSGTQNGYTGVPLGGVATGATSSSDYANSLLWSVQLYAGAGTGDAISALSPVSGTVANFYPNLSVQGYSGLWFSTINATISTSTTGGLSPTGQSIAAFGVAAGSPATLAIAAWYNGGGAYSSYNAAVAAGVPAGLSTTGSTDLQGGLGNNIPPPDLPAPGEPNTLAGGITSFNVFTTIPEPSTIALGVMGASALMLRLRRK